jgi:hypothetical protein
MLRTAFAMRIPQTAVLFGMIEAENAEDGFFDASRERKEAIVYFAKQMSRASQAENSEHAQWPVPWQAKPSPSKLKVPNRSIVVVTNL